MTTPHEFSEGDHVVYPPHGAGTIVGRAASESSDDEYLSIRIVHTRMTLMVPVAIATERGVRPLVEPAVADELLESLADAGGSMSENRQQRLRAATEQARTGGAMELVGLIRDLQALQDGGAKLSPSEQGLLASARRIFGSELALVRGIDAEAAELLIDDALARRDQATATDD